MREVSVITPMFNGAAQIERCIRSVAFQTEPVLEHIIIDNGSSDNGPDLVREMMKEYPHIRLLSETSRGPGPARNTGQKSAKGRYIAFLDCDDEWEPEKIERHLGAMRARGLGFSWTGFTIVNEDGSFDRIQSVPKAATKEDMLRKKVILGCLTVIYDVEVMGRLFLMNSLPLRQDFCLFLDLASACEASGVPMGGVDQPLSIYWKSAGSISADKKKAALGQWRAYREHFNFSVSRSAFLFAHYVFQTLRARA